MNANPCLRVLLVLSAALTAERQLAERWEQTCHMAEHNSDLWEARSATAERMVRDHLDCCRGDAAPVHGLSVVREPTQK